MSILFYKRPDYIARSAGPLNLTDCQKYVERSMSCKSTIPPELSFENVIQNRALPPCSIQDFMDYLVYVAHDAENLQFYLWLEDYTQRFEAASMSDKCLSPEWDTQETPRSLSAAGYPGARISQKTLDSVGLKDMVFDDAATIAMSANGSLISSVGPSSKLPEVAVAEANAQVGLVWQSFTIQPFRSEIARIISHYVVPGSPRELNLSHKDRAAVLHALQHTTHPSAFGVVRTMVESTLRGQSHPNFVRWSICNGNKPRVFFLRGLAIFNIALGFLIAVTLTLSSASRWFRVLAAITCWLGITNLVAAHKGLCVFLHRLHTRNIRPWEIGDTTSTSNYSPGHDEATIASSDVYSNGAKSNWSIKMETFGQANEFRRDSWVKDYQRRPLLRKVFDKQVRVREEGLRFMQNKIVKQAEAWATIITIVMTVGFVALPKGNLF